MGSLRFLFSSSRARCRSARCNSLPYFPPLSVDVRNLLLPAPTPQSHSPHQGRQTRSRYHPPVVPWQHETQPEVRKDTTQPAVWVTEFVQEDGPRGRDERGCDQGGRDDVS